MGSDTKLAFWNKILVQLCNRYLWRATIVKSEDMGNGLNQTKLHVIPNGVDLNEVKCVQGNINQTSGILLFAANPTRESKNFPLAQKAIEVLNDTSIKLKVVYNVSHKDIITEICNATVVLLTSRWEGSPNIVKEAMACNCPVVSTNVGDVKWLIDQEPGYYLTSDNPQEIAEKIRKAINFRSQRTGCPRFQGRTANASTYCTGGKNAAGTGGLVW